MPSPVKIFVYDLSNGLAEAMSMQLTGRQFDGIWHTSVVVFNKEFLYGRGIQITNPGCSQHGKPMQTIDIGETTLDEQTFDEYLAEMRKHYTADKYHILDFNCNTFTNDCTGFLTGGSVPSWIKDQPSEFLDTPLGATLRPAIDSMFGRPTTVAPQSPSNAPATTAALSALKDVSERTLSAAAPDSGNSSPSPSTSGEAPLPNVPQATAAFAYLLQAISERALSAPPPDSGYSSPSPLPGAT